MDIKAFIKNEVSKINQKHDYKIRFHQLGDGNIALHAVYRRKKVYDKKSLDLYILNRTTNKAMDRDKSILKAADEKLSLLDEKMDRRLSGKVIEMDFLEFFEACIDKPTKEGKIRSEGTKKNWRRVHNHLHRFIKEKYKQNDISFDYITFAFFSSLHSWFINEFKQYSANSMWSIIKRFIKYAVLEDRINDANLLLKIQSELTIKRPAIERTEKDYLSLDEIQRMIITPYYNRYKIPFLFNCYVGLRISDLKRLTWKSFTHDFSEIRIIEKKTGKPYNAPLHSFASDILVKLYSNAKRKNDTVFDLPKDDWKTNKHLKRWVKLAGLEKNMSTHVMRRTFLNLMEWSGVSLTSSSKMLNHSSVKITEQYYLAENKSMLKKELEKVPGLAVKNIRI